MLTLNPRKQMDKIEMKPNLYSLKMNYLISVTILNLYIK
jgi:hypothetical protein